MNLESIDIARSAVIVIDIQNDFFHENGAMGKANVVAKPGANDVFTVQKIVPSVQRFLAQARQSGIPVIYVRSEYSKWTDSPSFKKRGLSGADFSMHCRPGSWGAEFYRVTPEPDDFIVTKHRHSAFIDTDLELVLRSVGIRTIVLTGIATNVCVESTARDGFMKDYYVVLVKDCTAAWSKREHEAALFNIGTYFGAVASSQEIAETWQTTRKAGSGR